MPRKPRRQLTEAEIIKIEAYAAIRLPVYQIAALLDICKTELLYETKRNPAVQRAIDIGRSKASHNVRSTLFQMATGEKNEDGEYTRKPDFQSLRFWCETQEGFKRADKLEISGPEGGPIENTQLSTEQLKAKLIKLRQMNDLTEDDE